VPMIGVEAVVGVGLEFSLLTRVQLGAGGKRGAWTLVTWGFVRVLRQHGFSSVGAMAGNVPPLSPPRSFGADSTAGPV
jgi:hypothetical protein